MEITINTKQAFAAIWTVIAVVLSLIITLGMGLPFTLFGYSGSNVPWWLLVATFFGVLLVITLPVYLLIVLWAIAEKPERE